MPPTQDHADPRGRRENSGEKERARATMGHHAVDNERQLYALPSRNLQFRFHYRPIISYNCFENNYKVAFRIREIRIRGGNFFTFP